MTSLSEPLVTKKAAGGEAGFAGCDGGVAHAEENPLVPHVYAASGQWIALVGTEVVVAVEAVAWQRGASRLSSS